MAAPAPRCVCLMAITLAYRWEAAQERDFRFGSTLAYRLRIPTSIATLHDEAVAQMATAPRLITLAFGPVVGRNPDSLRDRAHCPSLGTDGSNPALSSGESCELLLHLAEP